MSRTYRFMGVDSETLVGYHKSDRNHGIYDYKRRKNIDMNSKDGQRFVAMMFRDGSDAIMNFKGPSWFHNFNQRKHRAKARKQIRNFMTSPSQWFAIKGVIFDIEDKPNSNKLSFSEEVEQCVARNDVVIESKPKREYYY